MITMNKVVLITALFSIVSCKSIEVTPGAERVRVLDAEPKGCLFVGEVSSVQKDKTVGTLETEMDLATRVDLRNKAHALGGNILIFLKGKKTNTLPTNATSSVTSNVGRSATKPEVSAKVTDAPKAEPDENGTLVFLATVFKCPSSILNQ